MFGVGLPELAVIAFIAVIFTGPERLPVLARQAGRMLRQLRSFAFMARDELRSELGPDYADLELTDLDPRTIVRKQIMEAMAEDDDPRPTRRPSRTLREGELPPFDTEAT
ncbi:MAG: sec-independent translocase [Nocardioidaceae bacterium]